MGRPNAAPAFRIEIPNNMSGLTGFGSIPFTVQIRKVLIDALGRVERKSLRYYIPRSIKFIATRDLTVLELRGDLIRSDITYLKTVSQPHRVPSTNQNQHPEAPSVRLGVEFFDAIHQD